MFTLCLFYFDVTKASEPLFVLLLSYYILEESQTLRVHLTLVPICLGVTLIVYGASTFNLAGFACAFAANVSSASRIVFYKTKLKDTSGSSAFTTYLNVGFVSFFIYIPIYALQSLINLFCSFKNNHNNIFWDLRMDSSFSSSDAFAYLIYGSLFNFLYNLFSLRVLSNVAPISHSVINIMKRVFIVLCSMAVFNTHITSVQWLGMVCADIGVFSYSIMKIRSQAIKVSISKERKDFYKKCIVYLVGLILIGSCFIGTGRQKLVKPTKPQISSMRLRCIERIKSRLFIYISSSLK